MTVAALGAGHAGRRIYAFRPCCTATIRRPPFSWHLESAFFRGLREAKCFTSHFCKIREALNHSADEACERLDHLALLKYLTRCERLCEKLTACQYSLQEQNYGLIGDIVRLIIGAGRMRCRILRNLRKTEEEGVPAGVSDETVVFFLSVR